MGKSMEKLLSKRELEEKIKNLVGIEKWYYHFLPDICWMSEETQIKRLRERGIKIGRTKLGRIKRTLVAEGLLQLENLPNGKRKNLKHKLSKSLPIRLERAKISSYRYTPEDTEYIYAKEINWTLLQEYTAEDINNMSHIDKIQLYMDSGFIVLPTNYPIFTENTVKCSCKLGVKCSNIGKHPVHRYKYIDSFNYEGMKDYYLKEFRNKPKLNIGFKVLGYSVLDVDNKYGGDKSLDRLLLEYEINLEDSISVECSNGQHIYVSNTHLKNTAGVLGKGLDVRSEGGFIVAPGSVHYSGKVYQWNKIGEPARFPEDWFYSNSEENEQSSGKQLSNRGNQAVQKRLKDIILPAQPTSDYLIREGERELTLFKWACRERGKGQNAEQIYDILITIRDTYCEAGNEPVTDEEVRDIATAASRYRTEAEKKLVG
jgi:hypothetical protein